MLNLPVITGVDPILDMFIVAIFIGKLLVSLLLVGLGLYMLASLMQIVLTFLINSKGEV